MKHILIVRLLFTDQELTLNISLDASIHRVEEVDCNKELCQVYSHVVLEQYILANELL